MTKESPDLVDIDFDIDRYIADGGKLHDIRFVTEDQVRKWASTFTLPAEVATARVARWARYSSAMLKQLTVKAAVDEHLSEDDLLALWKDSAS